MASEFELETVSTMEPLRSEWTRLGRPQPKHLQDLGMAVDLVGPFRPSGAADGDGGAVQQPAGRHPADVPVADASPARPAGFSGAASGTSLGPLRTRRPAARGQGAAAGAGGVALGPAAGRAGPGARALEHGAGWTCPLLGRQSGAAVRGGDWEGFLRERSANFREQVRRRPRKLAREHPVRYRLVEGREDLEAELDTLFRLHKGPLGGHPLGLLTHERFHRSIAGLAAQRNWLRLWILEIEGQAAAAVYGFRFAGVESYYQAGQEPSMGLLPHRLRAAGPRHPAGGAGLDGRVPAAPGRRGVQVPVRDRRPRAGDPRRAPRPCGQGRIASAGRLADRRGARRAGSRAGRRADSCTADARVDGARRAPCTSS